jgi:hypothetical protein
MPALATLPHPPSLAANAATPTAVPPSHSHASLGQILRLAASPACAAGCGGAQDVAPVHVSGVPGDVVADWIRVTGDAGSDEGTTIERERERARDEDPRQHVLMDSVREGMEGRGAGHGEDYRSNREIQATKYVVICKNQADRELLNLPHRIYFEGTREEKARMPHPTAPIVAFVNWAKQEAKLEVMQHGARWGCLAGLMPTRGPPETEEVDLWMFTTPTPAMD